MFVEIREGAASVREAADLKSLSVRVDGGDEVGAALHGLGEPAEDGAHAWLQVDALRAAAAATLPAAERADWAKGFDGMIAYATSKGWLSDDGRCVRAHIEPSRT
jgi:hypothetical protein